MASQEVITALESLHKELDKLEPAIKHVEMAEEVIKMTKAIPQKHEELINKINESDKTHKEKLSKIFEKEISEMAEENKKLQSTTEQIQKQIKKEIEEIEELSAIIKKFHDRVEKINFPERLDKLDATVSGIMAAIQSVQSRLDGLERNLLDRLKDVQDFLKESQKDNKAYFEKISKKQQLFAYITWGLVIIGIITITLIIKL